MTTPLPTLLSVKNLHVRFSQGHSAIHAVQGTSFSIAEQEIVGIVGESGSGKSVSMLSAMKLLPMHATCSADHIIWQHTDITHYTNTQMKEIWGKKIAYIYQEPSQSYDPLLNILSTFSELFLAHNPSMTKHEIESRAIILLQEVGIQDAPKRIKNYFHQFSGGMIQRVQIALALANNPNLLIADEPTTALDVTTQKKVIELLIHLGKSREMSMFFITHDFLLAASFVDRLIIMQNGTIVEEGTPKEILYSPQHEYTQTLLQSIIRFGDRYDK